MGPFYQHVEEILNIFNQDYDVIFETIFNNGTYNWLGLAFISAPFFLLLIFYLLWKYPYGKWWHWLIYVLIISVVVGIISWQIAYNGIFNSNSPDLNNLLDNNTVPEGAQMGYEDFAYNLLPKYAIINGVLASILSFTYSLILKQFSKIQIHLPF